MGVFNRIRAYQERKAYEKSVQFRQEHTPYGVMYGQLLAYRREAEERFKRSTVDESLEAAGRLRERVREAFMSHPAATEADFERCWPSLRDTLLKRHTLKVLDLMSSSEED